MKPGNLARSDQGNVPVIERGDRDLTFFSMSKRSPHQSRTGNELIKNTMNVIEFERNGSKINKTG